MKISTLFILAISASSAAAQPAIDEMTLGDCSLGAFGNELEGAQFLIYVDECMDDLKQLRLDTNTHGQPIDTHQASTTNG